MICHLLVKCVAVQMNMLDLNLLNVNLSKINTLENFKVDSFHIQKQVINSGESVFLKKSIHAQSRNANRPELTAFVVVLYEMIGYHRRHFKIVIRVSYRAIANMLLECNLGLISWSNRRRIENNAIQQFSLVFANCRLMNWKGFHKINPFWIMCLAELQHMVISRVRSNLNHDHL